MDITKDRIKELYFSAYFLIAFDFIKKDEVFGAFLKLLKTIVEVEDFEENLSAYFDFISKLFKKKEDNFSKYLFKLIQNSTATELFNGYNFDKELNIINDLAILKYEDIVKILIEKFKDKADFISQLPKFNSLSPAELKPKDEIKLFCDIYEQNQAFIFDNDFEIKPVQISENIRFYDLKGYIRQKQILYDNTLAFLKGSKVNNILLYGDAGCGKSSSIRALINEFKDIKIVQIFKNNLINLDKLYKKLEKLHYKFIIFADDISFVDSDDNFSTMKAILEGSLIQCPPNAVIYATSNRKHLVRESFQARMGDEIHLKDTINEITSLSERFGINLLFQKPSQKEFLDIVTALAKDNNIEVNDSLMEKAKKFASIKASTSPRTARQLIDNILACVSI